MYSICQYYDETLQSVLYLLRNTYDETNTSKASGFFHTITHMVSGWKYMSTSIYCTVTNTSKI